MNYARTFGDDPAVPASGPAIPWVWILIAAAAAFFLLGGKAKSRSSRSIQRQMDWEDEQEGRRMRKLREKK